jgi:chemotaxis protein MotB
MMTMFILFLTLYAYQFTHKSNQQYLSTKTPEVVAGTTSDALEFSGTLDGAFMPFVPIRQGAPLIISGTIKKVEFDVDGATSQGGSENLQPVFNREPIIAPEREANPTELSQQLAENDPHSKSSQHTDTATAPLDTMYDLSRQVLTENNLKEFASINLIPDNTMRIILTADLLFEPGKADLSKNARQSLLKVTAAIKNTPYMINVVGHTDNVPIKSKLYHSNWELSVARASRVVRFLIEENAMNSDQFEVSGYSSFRPLKQNTSDENRALNRRVEIIISKKLPPAEPLESGSLATF